MSIGTATLVVWALGAGVVIFGLAAIAVGWPAYRRRQAMRERRQIEDRYMGWRGRARPRATGSPLDDMQAADIRRRLTIAGALAAVAVACLIGLLILGG